MSQLPFNVLDVAIIGIVLLSAILASVRGFTREVLAIGSWVAAGFAAYAFHPMVLPFLEPYIANKQLVLAAAIASVFFAVLILVSIITVKISDLILDSSIGALDRTLGFLFGSARGFLIAVVAFMFFDYLVGEGRQPDMLRDARMRPLLKQAGDGLFALMPDDPKIPGLGKPKVESQPSQAPSGGAPAAPAKPGDQQGLRQLIDSTVGSPPAR
jgi:membrane protein required for colicin V production